MRASWHVIGIGEGLNIEKEGTINALLVATADLDTDTQVHRTELTPCMSMHDGDIFLYPDVPTMGSLEKRVAWETAALEELQYTCKEWKGS